MKLTPREREIVALVVKGEKREAIASALELTVWGVDFHLRNLRRKLGAACLVTVAVRAVRLRAG